MKHVLIDADAELPINRTWYFLESPSMGKMHDLKALLEVAGQLHFSTMFCSDIISGELVLERIAVVDESSKMLKL